MVQTLPVWAGRPYRKGLGTKLRGEGFEASLYFSHWSKDFCLLFQHNSLMLLNAYNNVSMPMIQLVLGLRNHSHVHAAGQTGHSIFFSFFFFAANQNATTLALLCATSQSCCQL